MKICKACKRELADTAFDTCWARGKLYGRRSTCRACMRVRTANREATKARESEPVQQTYRLPLEGKKRFLITSAQNATPVDFLFLSTLKLAAAHMGAELVVVPFRYKNPTSIWSDKQESEEWWDEHAKPYLHNTRKKLHTHLVLAADVKIQPTASSPLTGFESLTGPESCLIGHPKMQYKPVPVTSGRYPKVLSTTGACTKRNYTSSKAGKLGEFHHYLGAVVVELDGKYFHMRQINANRKDGSFIDKDVSYSVVTGVTKAPPALGIVFGDVHRKFIDKMVARVTFGPGGIVQILNPETLVWSDLLDAYSANPHHRGNPFIARAKMLGNDGDVRQEVIDTVQFVVDEGKGRKNVIVASNHDNFLSRWIIGTDWRDIPNNAEFYLETAQAMLKSVRKGPGGAEYADPFAYWVDRLKGDADIKALGPNESFMIADIEVGLHGDKGPNGSRGTMINLRRTGHKLITGHTHAPGIEEGHYKAGTSTPRTLEYTNGPSSWLNTHVVIYANGKRALISIFDDRWCLM